MQQCEQRGVAAHAPSTGTSAIRRAHNGPTQVAVCHARRAPAEIDRKAFPKRRHARGREKEQPVDGQMCSSLIMFIFTSVCDKFRFHSAQLGSYFTAKHIYSAALRNLLRGAAAPQPASIKTAPAEASGWLMRDPGEGDIMQCV